MESSKRKRKTWDRDKIEDILKEIKDNNLTTAEASQQHGIPITTLRDKLSGRSSLDARNGRPSILSPEEEDSLVFYVKYRVERGFPVNKKTILALALAIHIRYCEENGVSLKVDKTKGLSQKWWKRFKEKNALTLRKPDPLDRGRRDAVDERVVQEFFDLFKSTMTKKGLTSQPHRIYNCDETGFDLDPHRRKVVTFARMSAPATSVRKGTRDHISALECVAADGSSIPPLVIFSKSFPSTAYKLEGPDNALYATTPSGFIETDVFVQWLDKCFVRFCSAERPVLLLMDQHSTHVTHKAIDFAVKHDVILLGLPPHCTHFLQPLDAPGGPFSRMKAKFEDVVNDLSLVRPNFLVTKSSFPRIYRVTREESLTISTIKTGFRKTGLFPVDQSQIAGRWLKLNEVAASTTTHEEEEVGAEGHCRDLLPEEVDILAMAQKVAEDETHTDSSRALLDIEEEVLQLAEKEAEREARRNLHGKQKTTSTATRTPTAACYVCGARGGDTTQPAENPFVKAGIVPSYVSDILQPIPESKQRKRLKPKALVFDQEYLDNIRKEAEEEEERKREEQERKKEEREEKKRRKMQELEARRQERLENRQKKKEAAVAKKKKKGKQRKAPKGTSEASTSTAVDPRPRREARRPVWMADFTTEEES